MFRQVSSSRSFARLSLAAILIMSILALTGAAQGGYKKAPPEVSSILSAPVTPNVYVGPTRDAMLLGAEERSLPLPDIGPALNDLHGANEGSAS